MASLDGLIVTSAPTLATRSYSLEYSAGVPPQLSGRCRGLQTRDPFAPIRTIRAWHVGLNRHVYWTVQGPTDAATSYSQWHPDVLTDIVELSGSAGVM